MYQKCLDRDLESKN